MNPLLSMFRLSLGMWGQKGKFWGQLEIPQISGDETRDSKGESRGDPQQKIFFNSHFIINEPRLIITKVI